MPRKLRIEYRGAVYHVMSRGDRREAIFLDDEGRQDFLKRLAETCQKTGLEVHAYGLMANCMRNEPIDGLTPLTPLTRLAVSPGKL